MTGKRVVIDASVAVKWRLRDEDATQQADALQEDFLADKLVLLTPTLFDYEITNALRVAVTRQRVSAQDASVAPADFAQYAIIGWDFLGISGCTFLLFGQHQRSAYDRAYTVFRLALGRENARRTAGTRHHQGLYSHRERERERGAESRRMCPRGPERALDDRTGRRRR